MKVYISADIEGVTGVTSWDETIKGKSEYEHFRVQMEREVVAACQGVLAGGATEIWVKDAHETGRNLNSASLPTEALIHRGWSGDPFSMIEGIDPTFVAAVFIGYHSCAGSAHNPLSHTLNPAKFDYIKINGVYASEFLLHVYAAASVGVPVILVTGDRGLCDEVKTINSEIRTVAVKEGVGQATINIHPQKAVRLIEEEARKGMERPDSCKITLPKSFSVEIGFKKHTDAYKAAFYPGMKKVNATRLEYQTKEYFEVLRMLAFI